MRAFVIVSALLAVSSFGSAALARDGEGRESASRAHVARAHVAREHVAREHVAREHVARPAISSERVARPAADHADRARVLTPGKASHAAAPSSPSAAKAPPRVSCEPGSHGCGAPRAADSKASRDKKAAPKVERATSAALKRIVLAKSCVKDGNCDGL